MPWSSRHDPGPTRRAVGPAVAGSWYPADPDSLARAVDRLLDQSPAPQGEGAVAGLVAPHAGYMFSGNVAARAFRAVRGASFRRVLLVGPSHYGGFVGAVLPRAGACATPLGDVALDSEAVERLAREPGFVRRDEPFLPEHSLEAELPFLQRALEPGWTVVPVLLSPGTRGDGARLVADRLAPWLDEETLVVASSDFTHYGPRFGFVPFSFSRDVPERIRELDLGAIRLVESGDAEAFESYLDRTGATVCGRDAVGVLLRMLQGKGQPSLLDYDTSGRMTGDWEHSVSYAAILFRRTPDS
jgi:MEMO1 family protein